MDSPDSLGAVSEGCHWCGDSAAVLQCVPEITQVLRPLESWPIGQSGNQWVSPITGVDRLAGAIVETMERARIGSGETLLRARSEAVAADVLVAQLGTLLAGIGPGSVDRIVLGMATLCASLISGNALERVEPAVARRCGSLVEALGSLDPSLRAATLSRISDALTVRLAAALRLNGNAPSHLARRMISNRLIWVVSHEVVDVPLASAILDSPLDAAAVDTVQKIAACAIADAQSRVGSRRERPADTLLEGVLAGVHGDPLLNRRSGPDIIRLLPHLVDGRALKGRVHDHKQAARFLEPSAIRTVAGAWSDLVAHLGLWDVLGSVMGRYVLVSRTKAGWQIDRNDLDDTVRWSMAIPRAEPRRIHTVVAVRFGDVIAAGGGGVDVRRVVQRRWAKLLSEGQVGCWLADHGIAVFNRASDAVRFALTVKEGFTDSGGMLRTDTDPVPLTPGLGFAAGVAVGVVLGGRDGDHIHLDGPAVSEAMHLSGCGPLVHTDNDPLQIRRVGVGANGLESVGVTVSRSVATAAWNDWGGGVHRHGDGSAVAGVRRDFECYPVDGWAQHEGGAVLFFSLGIHRGGALLEAQIANDQTLRELSVRDEHLQSGEIGDDSQPSEEAPAVDPFGFGQTSAVASPAAQADWTDIGFGDDDGQ
jgi:hypothetical protein